MKTLKIYERQEKRLHFLEREGKTSGKEEITGESIKAGGRSAILMYVRGLCMYFNRIYLLYFVLLIFYLFELNSSSMRLSGLTSF